MPTSDWTPNVADIGSQLRARTKDDTGAELGTFTAATRPTDTEVQALIPSGVSDVTMVVGSELPASVYGPAKDVAIIATAMRVELTYFPEQINRGGSPYAQLKQLFDDKIKQLAIAVARAESGDNADPSAPPKPVSSFPMTGDPYIVGRRTAW